MPRKIVIIRLRLDDEILPSNDLRSVAKHHGLLDLFGILQDPRIAAERAVKFESVKKLLSLEGKYPAPRSRPRHSLTLYWRIDVSATNDLPETWLGKLRAFVNEISAAYLVEVDDQVFVAPNANCSGEQDYLGAAPIGVDARWAWTRYHGKGEGVKLIDLEAGWILSHEDLDAPLLHYLDNATITSTEQDHGAAVMGIVGAMHNANDVNGIAPELASLDAVSHYRLADNTRDHYADAVGAAVMHLSRGDILLIEAVVYDNSEQYPIEKDVLNFDAIALAVDAGIVVIEAAGQYSATGGLEIDSSLVFGDSGATIVGACDAGVIGPSGDQGHKRWQYSNYGAKVDCYAWGQCIVTAGYGDRNGTNNKDDNSYTEIFDATSGATAIIAGVAALVQGWVKARCYQPLSSIQMRTILSDPDKGTIQKEIDTQKTDVIGVMPNLRAILGWQLWWQVVRWCFRGRMARMLKPLKFTDQD